VKFDDVAATDGLDVTLSIKGKRPYNILDTMGSGCALLDYDGDGNLDILILGEHASLFKGDGKDHFTDVTRAMGLDKVTTPTMGCAVGDYDNDGFEDLYLSGYRCGILLHNEHGQGFNDVSAAAGIRPQPWGTSAAFVDIDSDGRLDLYVGNYVKFDQDTKPQLCASANGVMGVCAPVVYKPLRGVLYHNDGLGRFSDVTGPLNAVNSGNNLGVAFADFDGSGHQSLMLANDQMPGNLLVSDGHRFTDIGSGSGVATDAEGATYGGMGIDWGDYDNDGKLDVAVATFQYEPKCVFHNDGNHVFSEVSSRLGLASITRNDVSFGEKWLDADNDGWLDLMIANGHVQDNIAETDSTKSFRQPTRFCLNGGGSKLVDSPSSLSGDAGAQIVGRGLAIGDFDNDGKIDALVIDIQGHPLLLHNATPSAGHWLEVNLVGTAKSNRDGQGATVTAEAASVKILRECTTSGSYMSASDKRVHMGIGGASTIDTLSIHWPDGHVDTYRGVKADRIVTVREGQTATP